jgi:hypothetical protein
LGIVSAFSVHYYSNFIVLTDNQRMKYANLLKLLIILLVVGQNQYACAEDFTNTPEFWDGFTLGGYSSAGITAHSHGETEAAINEISLILSYNNNSRVSFFSELELEEPLYWNDQDKFSHDGSYLDLERFYFDFNLTEKSNIRAGRFLTPAGRWNLLHAAPLVWTTSRPLATSRLFPIATNGLMLFGAVPLTNMGLEYSVFAETLKDQHQDGDEILFKDIVGARLDFTGNTKAGIVLMHFKERMQGEPAFNMVGLDFLTQFNGWELSGEGFQRFYTDGKNGGSGAYLQTVAPLGNRWHAIARLETFQRPDESNDDKWLLGLAWRRTNNQILKLEVVGGDTEYDESPKGFLASFAILF